MMDRPAKLTTDVASPSTRPSTAAQDTSKPSTMAPDSRHPRWFQHASQERRQIATYAAFVGFGLASWIMTNASYVELGVFLRELPEKYSIVAYLIFALQSANIYPFMYMLLNAHGQRVTHSTAIWFLLVLGIIVAILMSLLWHQTTAINGHPHSVAMLVLTHLGGLVSATSTVVFYPYVAGFPSIFTSALSTGEGLSGSMAALLGVIQRPYDGQDMLFSVEIFYVACAGIMVVSLLSFAFLELHPWSKAAKKELDLPSTTERSEQVPLVQPAASSLRAMLRPVWPYLLCQLILAAFSFGTLPSIMPYVYKKYAPVDDLENATSKYQTIANIASLILDPVARFLTSWVRLYRVRELTVILVLVAIGLLVASLQAHPALSSSNQGYLFPLIAHVGYLVAYAYTQTMVYFTLKRISETTPSVLAHRVYQWSGFATQIGAFLGTIVIFPLVFFREDLFLRS
ncbi:hypothetical protein Poli38472_007047 [Pythium oligandrum]|uniref:Uncharacterized protein n=1 Tax=Pythium oligandrum TaxID=41045 RepID=A0A8K1CAI6_PYTOL|nr:hypothetical protein Poli38472_007047 [Pythium oligandrum]|eukprot:TMW58902.1 hypothetical protein Poli38472_007047 [Pythium oligandrum]